MGHSSHWVIRPTFRYWLRRNQDSRAHQIAKEEMRGQFAKPVGSQPNKPRAWHVYKKFKNLVLGKQGNPSCIGVCQSLAEATAKTLEDLKLAISLISTWLHKEESHCKTKDTWPKHMNLQEGNQGIQRPKSMFSKAPQCLIKVHEASHVLSNLLDLW